MEDQLNQNLQNIQPSDQIPANNPMGETTTSKPNYWMIVTIVLFILFVGTTTVLIRLLRNKEMHVVSLQQELSANRTVKPSPSIAPTISAIPVSTVSGELNIYKDSTYSFSFKYPADWLVEKVNENYQSWDKVIYVLSSKDKKNIPDVFGEIQVWKESIAGKKFGLEELMKTQKEKTQETEVSGLRAHRWGTKSNENTTEVLAFEYNNHVFTITFVIKNNQNSESNVRLVEEMIKSVNLVRI